MNKKTLMILIGVIFFGLGAFLLVVDKPEKTDEVIDTNQSTVTSGENPQTGNGVHDLPVEPAAAIVRADLATKLSVDEKSIVILNITENTWNDGCLGLGGDDEMCLQALVPGFRVELLKGGDRYFYRTNTTGSNFRAELR